MSTTQENLYKESMHDLPRKLYHRSTSPGSVVVRAKYGNNILPNKAARRLPRRTPSLRHESLHESTGSHAPTGFGPVAGRGSYAATVGLVPHQRLVVPLTFKASNNLIVCSCTTVIPLPHVLHAAQDLH